MVTGRISFLRLEYSPISSAVSVVRLINSSRHCRAATVLVTKISVVHLARAMAAAPTIVLPAPQGKDHHPGSTVPEGVRRLILVRAHGPARLEQIDRVGLTVDVAGKVFCRPAQLEQNLLQMAPL